jgi:FixJ family two-component response regulator
MDEAGWLKEPADEVFIIDDDFGVRDSLTVLLQGSDYKVSAFSCVEAFMEAAPVNACGCLLLDIRMPGLDGISYLPSLRDRFGSLLPVMITAHASVEDAVSAMKLGAVDFLRKPWKTEELIEVIDRVIDQARLNRRSVDEQVRARRLLAQLTPREQEVFEELLTGAPNKVVARRLNLSPRTVEFHRARILEKARASSVAELVHLKMAAGQTMPP